ncbi:MAG TPA: Gfo/Idh/MocA family oxidoreductase [Clostridia bacterium]|nr:Gfo/Idh/MocA family oxidoreductase [Clostridia bacterium]
MKVGILGTGFGAYHAELYCGMEDVEELYIYGRNEEKLKQLKQGLEAKIAAQHGGEGSTLCCGSDADRTGYPRIYITCSADDIIENRAIDLVDICLPSSMHSEFSVRAMQAGKHVYCETPVALDMKAAEAIGEAQVKYDRMVFVDLFLRFQGPYLYLKEMLDKQAFGRLKTLSIHRKTPPIWGDLGPQSIVTNLMIHDIDFVSWLLGNPGHITSACTPGKDGQCSVTGLMQYDGASVELSGSSMMPYSYPFSVSYEAVFDDAAVRFSNDGYKDSEEFSFKLFTQGVKEDIIPERRNCYEEAIRHVLSCIRSGGQPVNGIADAIASLELALKIEEQILG